MNNIKFEKVSYETFRKALVPEYKEEEIKEIYNNIKLPKRATTGSAGYDFYIPISTPLMPGQTIKIPTGIRAIMPQDVVLFLFPRSGLGFKYRMQLDNTVGIVDSDYAYSDNEGHIFAKVTNDSYDCSNNKYLILSAGDAFMQGIFMNYLTTVYDNTDGVRNGGFGSTDKKNV